MFSPGWGLKCQCEIFLLISSVSPHHAVPQGQGISSEKRKPLPHYAANFRHQEKMFGNFWPRFQVLPALLSIPRGEAGVILVLEQAQRNNLQHIQWNFKSVLSESGIKHE